MKRNKFRVWNKKTGDWVDGCGRHEIASLDGVNLFGETILLGAFMNGVPLEDLNECVALQYTGLEDKNGKEIFEGDILEGKEVGFVEYKDGVFRVKQPGKYFEGYELWIHYRSYEVIGNIFENPELLK